MILHLYLSVVFHDKYQSYKYEKYSREICYLAGRVETNTLEQIFQLWGRDRKITIQFNFALIGFICQIANLKAVDRCYDASYLDNLIFANDISCVADIMMSHYILVGNDGFWFLDILVIQA